MYRIGVIVVFGNIQVTVQSDMIEQFEREKPRDRGWYPLSSGAIGEVNSAAVAIIAAECTPPQESRCSSSAGLGHLGIVKLNFN